MKKSRLDEIIRPLPEPTFLLGQDGVIESVNPAASILLKSSAADLCGRHVGELVEEPSDKIERYLANCGRSGQLLVGSITWRLPDGQALGCRAEGAAVGGHHEPGERLILLRIKTRSDPGNNFASLNKELDALKLANRELEQRKAKLVGELKTHAEALAASENRCRAIVEAAGDAIVTLSFDGEIESYNLAASTVFGYTMSEIKGKSIACLLPNVDGLEPLKLLDASAAGRDGNGSVGCATEAVGRRKDGRLFPLELSVSHLTVRDHQIYILIMRDISERKRAEQQLADTAEALTAKASELERMNRELDQFAYVTSHDLKAPLRAIANLSQWIEEDLGEKLEGDTRHQMELLRGRVRRMEALIEGILQYSRVGRLDAEIEMVDTNALVEEVIDSLQPPAEFRIDVDPQMPSFEAPRVGLQQVFANLIGNAVKYHDRADGRIRVSVEDADRFFAFTITDDGPGIDAAYHGKIFMIFQTLDAKDKRESTGIGLTIVKKIVEDQGGTIVVQSESGKGAAFRFLWPKQPRREKEGTT